MDRLTAMSMFVRVAESGSFSAVAKELETTQPTVSKNVAELEVWLGVKLLNRSTRSLHLTEAGADYYERCISILMDIDEAEQNVGSLQSQPRGTVRVTTPAAFGELYMVPCLKGFFQQYPDIKVDLMLNDRSIDLIQEGIDMGIRMGNLSDSNLIARQLATSPMVTVASKDYLAEHGTPQHPRDIKQHNYIIYSGRGQAHDIEFSDGDVPVKINVHGNLMTNSSDAIRQALLSGHGISKAPKWLVGDALADGRLVSILDEFNLEPMPLSAVYPSGRHLPSKARCLLDYLADTFSKCPDIN
jgi:DNA-binding transcriptional LysR family regulator